MFTNVATGIQIVVTPMILVSPPITAFHPQIIATTSSGITSVLIAALWNDQAITVHPKQNAIGSEGLLL
jgi:hypothetical protein